MDKELLLGQVDKILGPVGIAFKDGTYVYSERQHDYARRAMEGFLCYDEKSQKASINAIQAATGTGKTLGYLVPLFLYSGHSNERVAVSTFTRFLQRQILRKDAIAAAGWVKKITGRSLTIARRVGLTGYISALACARLIDALKSEDEDRHEATIRFLEDLQDWVEKEDRKGNRINSGVLDDYLEESIFDGLPVNISEGSISLKSSYYDESDFVNYDRDISLSKSCDVLIVNHALLALNAYRWSSVLDDERPISVLVCDEADRLHDAACSMLAAEIPVHKLNAIVVDVSDVLRIPELGEASKGLYSHIMSLKPDDANIRPLTGDQKTIEVIDRLLRKLNSLCLNIIKMDSTQRSLIKGEIDDSTRNDVLAFCQDLQSYRDALNREVDGVAVVSWSPVRAYPSLRMSNPRAGRVLARYWSEREWAKDIFTEGGVRSYLKAALFTSATLGVPGRALPHAFDAFFDDIGVMRLPKKGDVTPIHNVRTELFAQFEPKKFGRMRFVLADPRISGPTMRVDEETAVSDPAWLDFTAQMISFAREQGGRTLVLTTSFADAKELYERVGQDDVLLHEPNTKLASLLNQYEAVCNSVLITPSGWEGVDLPGMVQNLVITRLPFGVPKGVEQEILRLELVKKGLSEDKVSSIINGRSVLNAKRKLQQGLGRGIRASKDSVTVWIADPRFPMPEAFVQSVDPVMLEAQSRKIHQTMVDCIPRRFLPDFEKAKLFLREGEFYSPEV